MTDLIPAPHADIRSAWDGYVAVADLGEDFAAAVPAADADIAHRAGRVPVVLVEPGPWTPPASGPEDPLALVVLSGALLRQVALGGRVAAQVVDDGEVIHTWHQYAGTLDAPVSWTALEPVRAAVLGRRFARLAERWGGLQRALHNRSAEQVTRTAVHGAILMLPRVEQRIVALLWHLADRRGRMGADGVTVELPVTHEQLGRLVAAQRPTTSLALTRLADLGAVTTDGRGTWLLSRSSTDLLDGDG